MYCNKLIWKVVNGLYCKFINVSLTVYKVLLHHITCKLQFKKKIIKVSTWKDLCTREWLYYTIMLRLDIQLVSLALQINVSSKETSVPMVTLFSCFTMARCLDPLGKILFEKKNLCIEKIHSDSEIFFIGKNFDFFFLSRVHCSLSSGRCTSPFELVCVNGFLTD